jgi:hypothetical protein
MQDSLYPVISVNQSAAIRAGQSVGLIVAVRRHLFNTRGDVQGGEGRCILRQCQFDCCKNITFLHFGG